MLIWWDTDEAVPCAILCGCVRVRARAMSPNDSLWFAALALQSSFNSCEFHGCCHKEIWLRWVTSPNRCFPPYWLPSITVMKVLLTGLSLRCVCARVCVCFPGTSESYWARRVCPSLCPERPSRWNPGKFFIIYFSPHQPNNHNWFCCNVIVFF